MKKTFSIRLAENGKKRISLVLAFALVMLAAMGFLVIDPERASREGLYWVKNKAPSAPASSAEAGNISAGSEGDQSSAPTTSMPSKLRRLGSEPDMKYSTAYVNDVACVRLPIFDNKLYAAIWQFASILGEDMNGESIGDTKFKVSEQGTYLEVGERAVVPESDIIKTPTKIYYPLELLCDFYNLSYKANDDLKRVDFELKEGSEHRIKTAAEVYDGSDLYWLSRLIEAESRNEPLEGKIAVGNVVLNRVRSEAFPGDVIAVIFDREHGVQFSPAESGTINLSPGEESTVAAKLCFEGVDMADGSFYFVNPKTGDDSWFKSKLTFIKTIGRHDFYA